MNHKRLISSIEDENPNQYHSAGGRASVDHFQAHIGKAAYPADSRSLFYHESISEPKEPPTLSVEKVRNATDPYTISETEFLDFLSAVFHGASGFVKFIFRAFGYTLLPFERLRSRCENSHHSRYQNQSGTVSHHSHQNQSDIAPFNSRIKPVSKKIKPTCQKQLDFSEPASHTQKEPLFDSEREGFVSVGEGFLSNRDVQFRPLRRGDIVNKDYKSRLLTASSASSASSRKVAFPDNNRMEPAESGPLPIGSLSYITESLRDFNYNDDKDEVSLSSLWELFKETTLEEDDRRPHEEDFALYRSILQEKKKRQELLSQLRVEKPQKVKPLTGHQLSDVLAHWRSPVNRLVKSIFNADIYTDDLKRLKDGKWLNDNIIDVYLSLIVQRSKDLKGELADVFAFTTHFYSTLSKRGHSGVARWAKRKKIDVTNLDFVFVPVNVLNSHWTLAVINNKQRRFQYCDSMNGDPGMVLRNLKDYMIKESERIYGPGGKPGVDYNTWGYDRNVKCPQQENGFDCGVFVCTNVEYLSRQQALSFSQSDMSILRQRMAFEILTERLLEK